MPGSANEEPKLNSYTEHWVRSVKAECLPKLVLFGEHSLRRAISNFLEHFHHERHCQSNDNLLLFPTGPATSPTQAATVRWCERLGGLPSTAAAPHEFFGHTRCRPAETPQALSSVAISLRQPVSHTSFPLIALVRLEPIS
jgi:hypothetical protein